MPSKKSHLEASQHGHYHVLMDWWVATLVLLFLGLFVVSVPLIVWIPLAWWSKALTIGFALCVILYLVDIIFFTSYYLDDDALLITSQLRHFTFPYHDMVKIKQGNAFGLLSFIHHRRFALSAKCYYIQMENQGWRSISVSPKYSDKFINQLLHNIDLERSKRATVDAASKMA
jgi:hypothetical protein